MKNKAIRVLAFCSILAMGSLAGLHRSAHAHAVLEFPAPRAGSDPGNQAAPCGPYPVSSPTVLQTGSTITVRWEETIHHSGNFQFYFAPSTVTTQTGVLPTAVPSPTPSAIPLYAVAQSFNNSNNLPHQYTAQVTLPSTPCTNCTLQMYQVNSDGVTGAPTYPAPGSPGIVYYLSCADIQLSTTAVNPTPTPTPTTDPVACTPSGGGGGAPAPTFTNVNNLIIQPSCIGCHATPTAANANTSFADYMGVLSVVDITDPAQSLIYQLTEEGPAGGGMPQGGTALSPALETLLLQWIQAGAPNN